MIFQYHNTPIHYQKQGSGPVLVFLHGFLESSTMWDAITPNFINTHTVITVDLPGFGASECVAEIHSMELMAILTSEILANQKIKKATLIGHSMGGYVALAFAELFPDRIEKLILLNASPLQDSVERKENRTRALHIIDKNKEAFISMAIGNLFTKKERTNHAVAINKLKKEAKELSIDGIKAAIKGMRDRKDRTLFLASFDKEKHIISGTKDPIVLYNEIANISEKTKTTLHTLENGHMSWLTNLNENVKILHLIV